MKRSDPIIHGNDAQNDAFDARERNAARSDERFEAWMQTATRYFVLSNAGGAIAVLSFLGTRAVAGLSACLAVFALFCFFAGVIVAGIAIMGRLTGAYRTHLIYDLGDPMGADASIKKHWTTRWFDQAEPMTGRLLMMAFGLFVLGGLVGVIGLAVATAR